MVLCRPPARVSIPLSPSYNPGLRTPLQAVLSRAPGAEWVAVPRRPRGPGPSACDALTALLAQVSACPHLLKKLGLICDPTPRPLYGAYTQCTDDPLGPCVCVAVL